MQENRITTKALPDVIAAIDAMDLMSVKVRMMDEELGEGWSQEYADSIEAAYKTYLTMLAKYPEHAEEIMLGKGRRRVLAHPHSADDEVRARLRESVWQIPSSQSARRQGHRRRPRAPRSARRKDAAPVRA